MGSKIQAKNSLGFKAIHEFVGGQHGLEVAAPPPPQPVGGPLRGASHGRRSRSLRCCSLLSRSTASYSRPLEKDEEGCGSEILGSCCWRRSLSSSPSTTTATSPSASPESPQSLSDSEIMDFLEDLYYFCWCSRRVKCM